ncbi:putative tetratricopeptide-like helical domain superfamily [Dioscorea sansibarensis]
MSRRVAAIALSSSPAVLSCLRSNACFLKGKSQHPFPCYSTDSFPDDDLQGLIDPEFSFRSDGVFCERKDPRRSELSAKDFAFLEEAVAERPVGSAEFSEEAVLISREIRDCRDGFDNKTEKFLRRFRGKLNEGLVVEVLRLTKDAELAVKFFIWAGRQIGYSHTGPTYDALIESLGFEVKTRVPDQILRDVGEDDKEVLGKLLNVIIQKCCRNGLWNQALEELGRLKDLGYKASKSTYNALILVFLNAERLDSALLVHREMSDSGFCMDRSTVGCLARALCKVGRWVEALNMIEKEDFTLDTILGTQMISGLLDASLFEEAMSFLHRMRSNSCAPNVVTYRTLLSGFLRKKQLGWCKRIMNMMMKEGCNPNPSLFNSLVHAYCSCGDYAYAYKLLKRMSACGCQPGYVTYNILIGGICGNEELPSSDAFDLAEKAYEEMLDAGLVLNKVNVTNFARCICAVGKFDKAFEVIKQMMSKGFVPDASTYANVISLLCGAQKVEKALLLFEEMKGNHVVPDVYVYTILIDSFCKIGLIHQAHIWFEEMIRDGCNPNVVTYTALIHAYLKSKQLSEASELFNKMLSMGCLPNVVTYTALIDGLCKAGQIDKACSIYSKMRGTCEDTESNIFFDGGNTNLVEPNVFTYGALVDGLCKAHKVVEARDLLGAMASAGCEPNHVVYDALIDGFCKAGRLDEAQEIFLRMSERGYIPNVFTYSALIDKLFKDRRLDLALKVLSKMLENSCAPNVVTYTEMIDGLCKVGKTEEAFKLLTMMAEKGCNPNVVTYTAIIDGFGKAKKVGMCLELYKQMTSKGCAPNFITFRVLINHCCAAGLLDEARNFLEEMKQSYWPRHVASYRKVIQGFSRKFIVSLGLLDEISECNSVPIASAYRLLIDSFTKAYRLETALELHEEIKNSSSCAAAVSLDMYSSLIEGLCLASKVEKAFQLYSEMMRKGHVPELSIFLYLIKGLTRSNRWDEALQLSYSIYHMDINWHKDES